MELWVTYHGYCKRELVVIKSGEKSLLVISDRFLFDLVFIKELEYRYGYNRQWLMKSGADRFSVELIRNTDGFIMFITNLTTKQGTVLSTSPCQN